MPGCPPRRFVRGLRQGTAGIEIFLYGGIVPIREVGDEVQQSEAQDVPVGFLSAVKTAVLHQRLPLHPCLVIAALAERPVRDGSIARIR